MCLTMPGQVVAIGPAGASIRYDDEEYQATTLLCPDIAVGDYVLVQAGTILERLSPAEAAEMTAALQDMLDLLASDTALVTEREAG